MRLLIACFLLTIMCFSSCHRKQPNGVLSEQEMEAVLEDFHLAKSLASQKDSSDFYREYYFRIMLKKHGISQKEFDTSLEWYAQHSEELYKIYSRIHTRLEREMSALGVATSQTNIYASLSHEGDTANIWKGGDYYLLSPQGVSNRMTFRVEADSTFHPGDIYLIHFNTKFVFSQGPRDAYISFALVYDNDSVQCITSRIYRDGEFSLQHVSGNQPLKCVEGFVYLNASTESRPALLFITQPALIRFHDRTRADTSASTDIVKTDSLKADTLCQDTVVKLTPSKPMKDIPDHRQNATPILKKEMNEPDFHPEDQPVKPIRSKRSFRQLSQ